MGPNILLGIIFIIHLQKWPPMVVKFLTSGVWKVLYMGGIQNEQVQEMTNPTDQKNINANSKIQFAPM